MAPAGTIQTAREIAGLLASLEGKTDLRAGYAEHLRRALEAMGMAALYGAALDLTEEVTRIGRAALELAPELAQQVVPELESSDR
jgi:hypothetical protein